MRKVWEDSETYIEPGDGGDTVTLRSSSGASASVVPTLEHLPRGLSAVACHAGVAADPELLDFSVVRLDAPAVASAVYTRNLCQSPAVTFDRPNTKRGSIQLVCVVSKNANVFTPNGLGDVQSMASALAREFDVDEGRMLISCTGVIGRPLPLDGILGRIAGLRASLATDAMNAVSTAILTTDKRPKCASLRLGDLVIGGYAKGAGMIEPNMATMLVYLYTNARLEKPALDRALKLAVDRTFNSLSVDSDTSTSDTVALLATGERDVTSVADFELALAAVCLKLARAIAREAEGATKLLEVTVRMGTSAADAYYFAKKVVNSPLVKTAVHGADPNWGRITMAIGKPAPGSPLLTIVPEDVTIAILGRTLFARGAKLDTDLAGLSKTMKAADTVDVEVTIGNPTYTATVWGCDLSPEYVIENSHYTT